jgi:hypothetical protein
VSGAYLYSAKYSAPPTVKSQSAPANYEESSARALAWIDAVQKKGSAEVPCQPNKEGSDCTEPYHNALDLAAQWLAAKSADAMVTLTGWQLVFGVAGLFGVFYTLVQTQKNLRVAERTIEITERGLVASQRPWLSAGVEIASALVFTEKEGRLTFHFPMKNFGQSPAINVEIKMEIVFYEHLAWEAMDRVTEDARRRKTYKQIGFKIFPGETFTARTNALIKRSGIDAAAAKMGFPDWKDFINPVIVGCAVYNSTFNDENHVTQFVGHFGLRDLTNPNRRLGIPTKIGTISPDMMRMDTGFGSGRAD